MQAQIKTNDTPKLARLVGDVEKLCRNPTPLLKRWGVVLLQDVQQTFKAGGRPKWAPLKASTVAARRGGSSRPLQNTGMLEKSFNVELHPKSVTLFSNSKLAFYHELGTGLYGHKHKKYSIVARRAKALAIPTGAFTLAGLGRSKQTATGGFVFTPAAGQKRIPKRLAGRVGKTVRPHKGLSFFKSVKHPGVEKRPMLPDPKRLIPNLIAKGNALMDELKQKAGCPNA